MRSLSMVAVLLGGFVWVAGAGAAGQGFPRAPLTRWSAMPAATATFSESMPGAMGILTSRSAAASAPALSPWPSVPSSSTTRSGAGRWPPSPAMSAARAAGVRATTV